jgi:hypothetical protein
MLLHSLNRTDVYHGAASGSQSTGQHLQGNLNTATGFGALLSSELALPAQPPLPGTFSAAEQPAAAGQTPGAPLPERKLSTAETEKIHTTAQQLESLMLYQMLKQMWQSIPESSLIPEGNAGQMYREMWLEKVAAQAAQSGDGIGIAKVVEREMRDKARHTFTPEQAALLQR